MKIRVGFGFDVHQLVSGRELKARIPEMQLVLAHLMRIDVDDVSVKATTTEKLGFTGREEGISAYATVLIEKAE